MRVTTALRCLCRQEIISAFNRQGIITQDILLNQPEVWVFTHDSDRVGQKVLVEPYISNFEKFNTNTGTTFDDGQGGQASWDDLMQALSHFSYHATGGQCVLCDLQGGMTDEGMVLTDPVILSRTREYGCTDLGVEGISTFFARHRCTCFCEQHWQLPRQRRAYFPASIGTTFM